MISSPAHHPICAGVSAHKSYELYFIMQLVLGTRHPETLASQFRFVENRGAVGGEQLLQLPQPAAYSSHAQKMCPVSCVSTRPRLFGPHPSILHTSCVYGPSIGAYAMTPFANFSGAGHGL